MKAFKLSPPPPLPVADVVVVAAAAAAAEVVDERFKVGLFEVEVEFRSSFLFLLTGVLRGVFVIVFSVFVCDRLLRPPPFVVADDDVDEAGDIERSSLDLSLPRGLRPLVLLREFVRRLLANQSSSYSASVLRLFLRFLKLRSSSSSSSKL